MPAVESLATGADSRESWKRGRRCIIPALGFFEWHVNPDATEQPYYIHPDDQDVFGFAGLWAHSRADANTVTESCSIITLPANPLMTEIHNSGARMPALLTREQRELWLVGSTASAGMALAAYADERLLAYAVSDRINSPHSNDESLWNRSKRTSIRARRIHKRPRQAELFAGPAGGFLMQVPSVKHLPG